MVDILLLMMMMIEVLDSAWNWESHIWTSLALLHWDKPALYPVILSVSQSVLYIGDFSSNLNSLGLDFCRLMEGFLGNTVVKESTCWCRRRKRCRFNPWVGKIRWNWKWQPTLVFFLGKSHGLRSLVGYSPWGAKGWTWLKWLSSTHTAQSVDC